MNLDIEHGVKTQNNCCWLCINLFQIQADAKVKKYAGPVDCAKQLYKQGGIRSVYKGTAATLLRGTFIQYIQLTYSGVFFTPNLGEYGPHSPLWNGK